MRKVFKRLAPALIHVLAWLGFIVYEQSTFFLTGTPPPSYFFILILYPLNALLFYGISEGLLPRIADKRPYWQAMLAVMGLTAVFALVRAELAQYLWVLFRLTPPKVSYLQLLLSGFYRGLFFAFISTGYWFARRAVQLEQHKREQEHQLRVAEKNLFEANLAFLRNQINPHFLFNSLNFLYAQVYPHSEPAAEGILLLADTMRYALHENIDGKVPLAQEVQHLHNYIALNQLRFNHQLQVDFQEVGSMQFVLILPLVLITFVENCFKHGELADPAHPLRIRLTVAGGQLTFETHNRKRHGPKEQHSGIGLANTRARLDLVYPARHSLTIVDTPDAYTCHLTLEL
jgi:sensor histidine kinase YesM